MITLTRTDFWENGDKINVYIKPYSDIQSALRLLPSCGYKPTISCSFNPISINGHSTNRWSGLYHECIIVAKFCKTIYLLKPTQIGNYTIIEDSKLFWTRDKYEISYDKHSKTITIKTGQPSTLGVIPLNLEPLVVEVTRKMISEIGFDEAKKICNYSSQLADD